MLINGNLDHNEMAVSQFNIKIMNKTPTLIRFKFQTIRLNLGNLIYLPCLFTLSESLLSNARTSIDCNTPP